MKLFVLGLSPYAAVAAALANDCDSLEFAGYTVDRAHMTSAHYENASVTPLESLLEEGNAGATGIFVAIGYRAMRQRQQVFERVRSAGFVMPNLISEHAIVDDSVTMGSNNIIMAGAVIEHAVSLGDNNTVWSQANLCHHSEIGSHNFFAVHSVLGGCSKLGDRNFFGFSSVVEQEGTLGDENVLGAMSYLRSSAGSFGKWLGIPAQESSTHESTGVEILPTDSTG
jgi:UDP-3-O-[3-hydroxymyristoyl] glucosamine N-acyltransferase